MRQTTSNPPMPHKSKQGNKKGKLGGDQRFGEYIGEHFVCYTIFKVNLTILHLLTNEVILDVNVPGFLTGASVSSKGNASLVVIKNGNWPPILDYNL